jgi:hypothetical protein
LFNELSEIDKNINKKPNSDMFNVEDNEENLHSLDAPEMDKRLAMYKKMREQLLQDLQAMSKAE